MPAAAPVVQEQGIIWLIRRRWRSMSLTFAVTTVLGGIALQLMPPSYNSSAKLLITRTEERLGGLDILRESLPSLGLQNGPVYTQVELLRALPIYQEVIQQLDLRDAKNQPLAPSALAEKVQVEPIEKTDLIQISHKARNPEKAQQIVAAVCAAYLRQAETRRSQGVSDGLRYVDEQVKSARARVNAAEAELLAFKRRSGLVALSQEVQAAVGEKSAIDNETRTLQVELARSQAKAQSLRQQLGLTARAGLDAAAVSQNARLQALQAQLVAAETAGLRFSGLGPDHPDLVANNRQIESLKRTIAEETRALVGKPSTGRALNGIELELLRDLATAETEARAASSSLGALATKRGQLESGLQNYPSQEITLARLTRELEVSGELYQQVRRKSEEARLNLAVAPTNAQIVQPASLPSEPVAPLKGPSAPILALAGIVAAFGVGTLRELLDKSLPARELKGLLPGLRIFAGLPYLSASERREDELVVRSGRNPAYGEALRSLGYALNEQLDGKGGRVIALTSATSGEGKTVTLANLALSLAQDGHHVLLVDADFRRPKLQRLFQQPENAGGLYEVLTGHKRPGEVIRSLADIDLVTAGEVLSPVRLPHLKQPLKEALAAWRQEYDYVLLDLPPIVVLSEVAQAAQHADALLLLGNLQAINPELLVASAQQLRDCRAPLKGLVAISTMLEAPKGGERYLIAGKELRP